MPTIKHKSSLVAVGVIKILWGRKPRKFNSELKVQRTWKLLQNF